MPGTSPWGPRWKWRWRGDPPPLHRPCFHYTGKNGLPEYSCEDLLASSLFSHLRIRPPQHLSTINTNMCANYVKLSAFMCLFLWKLGSSTSFLFEKWEREWPLSKSCSAKTNKRLSQRRENILRLIDVSSLCICFYFHCQGPLWRRCHRLATIASVAIARSFVALILVLEWERGAFTPPVSYVRGVPPSFLFPCQALKATGSVGQSSWRLITCLQL